MLACKWMGANSRSYMDGGGVGEEGVNGALHRCVVALAGAAAASATVVGTVGSGGVGGGGGVGAKMHAMVREMYEAIVASPPLRCGGAGWLGG